ncbi:hypothetical protein SH139x_000776 [Planctomycetaceae bacterium SH139]
MARLPSWLLIFLFVLGQPVPHVHAGDDVSAPHSTRPHFHLSVGHHHAHTHADDDAQTDVKHGHAHHHEHPQLQTGSAGIHHSCITRHDDDAVYLNNSLSVPRRAVDWRPYGTPLDCVFLNLTLGTPPTSVIFLPANPGGNRAVPRFLRYTVLLI